MTSAYLAGTAAILGRPARHDVMVFLTGRQILVILACGVAIVILLALPVLGEFLKGEFTSRARRVAPTVFLLGLGVLIIGLIAGAGVLDILGASMMGLILFGMLLEHY